MPWKQGYTISDEIGLRDADIRWPDGNRSCVTVVVDHERGARSGRNLVPPI